MKHIKKILVIALAALMVLTVFTACSASPEKKLIGSWRDSTGLTGYEFKEDGKCVVTFADVNIPIFNVNFNGSVDGVYSVAKRDDGLYYVTITYTIYAKSITKDYMFTVEDSALTLQDTEDNTVTVLMAYTAPTDSTVAPSAADATVAA
ncbi:MAG: hypothetical protein E7543_06390 [Ruminococcaceae bacterium]|nr:hypothetical protein [Oscillospiraceae bacterium]